MHFGAVLPSYGRDATPDGIRRTAELAEELGFDSVWTTEHIIVGPQAAETYGRFMLGVGMGWHADEYEFMGVPFKGRGRRGDEAIRLMRALWRGERDFEGELWSFHDATFEPRPSVEPEIWVGGSSERAIRRALTLGDAWHPSRGSDADHVRRVKEQHPGLRVIPRAQTDKVDAMLDAGADGAVVRFADEAA